MSFSCNATFDRPHSPTFCDGCYNQQISNKLARTAESQLNETKKLNSLLGELLDSREDDEPKPRPKATPPIKYTPPPVVVQQSEESIQWQQS